MSVYLTQLFRLHVLVGHFALSTLFLTQHGIGLPRIDDDGFGPGYTGGSVRTWKA